jgi:hypothetical protein
MEIFGCFVIPFGILSLASTIFWVWMLIECATKEKTDQNRQLVWIVVIAVTNIVGALIYFFVRRPDRIEEYGE